MRIVYTASEVAGFAKTGGLADVAAALPRALAQRGHDCCIFLPFYQRIRSRQHQFTATGVEVRVPLGEEEVVGSIWQTTLPDSAVTVYLIEQPDFFGRDDHDRGLDLYTQILTDGSQVEYSDNSSRFIFLTRATLEALDLLDLYPDIVHSNDWQTGLTSAYLRELYSRHSRAAVRQRYQRIGSIFTVHNIAYQGNFPPHDLTLTGLPVSLFNYRQLEFYGRISFLKAGLVFSDAITTVSPTYAREIQTATYGAGLQGALRERSQSLRGIVNGVDYGVWDPARDCFLPRNYTPESVVEGKGICKQFLQQRLGLPGSPRTPLLGMVSRLATQKGLDLLGVVANAFLNQGVQLIVLGEGELRFHQMLEGLREGYPRQVGLRFELNEELAHQIEAGADIFLMPSLFEPCGLNQMYSLKYGTVPVVRATGGLADTVTDTDPATLAAGTATGFSFGPPGPAVFRDALDRALVLYRDHPQTWLQVQRTGMAQDWSWGRSAAEYERIYEGISSQ